MNKIVSFLPVLLVTCVAAFSAHAQDATGDAGAGEKKISMCIGCHGIAGYQATFPEVYKVPMIAGQGAKYIVSALAAYKKGERKHPTMRGIVDNLNEQDMADIGAYYQVQGYATSAVPPAKAVSDSARVTAMLAKGACLSCHGDNLSKPIDPSFPKVAGQHADYLFVALKSYKTEGNTTWGRNNSIMSGIARQFSNAELKELANYVGALPGELKTVAQAGFR